MEDVGIFYGHLVHFMVFCYILWTLDIVRGKLVYFSPFCILCYEKSGNPGLALKTELRPPPSYSALDCPLALDAVLERLRERRLAIRDQVEGASGRVQRWLAHHSHLQVLGPML
jgi:hypothetical protein